MTEALAGGLLPPQAAKVPQGREQTRARDPDETGYVTRDGVRLYWERYGDGERTVLLLPTWSIVHSRAWKLQIPYLARHFRVLTFDGRGNGRSDRPAGAEAYATTEFAADAFAVMDATGTASAALVALSCGALWATIMAATSPERVERIAYIGPAVPLAADHVLRSIYSFDDELDTDAGWAKYNSHYWLRAYEDFIAFFAAQCLHEPHSTKQIEDFIGWALDDRPGDARGHDLWTEGRRHRALGRAAAARGLPDARAPRRRGQGAAARAGCRPGRGHRWRAGDSGRLRPSAGDARSGAREPVAT